MKVRRPRNQRGTVAPDPTQPSLGNRRPAGAREAAREVTAAGCPDAAGSHGAAGSTAATEIAFGFLSVRRCRRHAPNHPTIPCRCSRCFAGRRHPGRRRARRVVCATASNSANSHSGTGSELNIFTGWQWNAPGPLLSGGNDAHAFAGCSSQGSCAVSSDYGTLRCSGTGSGNNCPTSGVFLWLDQDPQANFVDTVTVTSQVLPLGTPVQLQVVLTLDGFANVVDSAPLCTYRASVAIGSIQPTLNDTPGVATATYPTTVGAALMVNSSLHLTLRAQGLQGLGIPPASASFAADLTARTSVECNDPRVVLQWCSGRTYPALTASAVAVGGGCGATFPTLSAAEPRPWARCSLDGPTRRCLPQPVAFVASFGPPVASTIGSCLLLVDSSAAFSWFAAVTDGAGGATFGLQVPTAPGFAGVQLTGQALVLGSGGPLLSVGDLSNAVAVRFSSLAPATGATERGRPLEWRAKPGAAASRYARRDGTGCHHTGQGLLGEFARGGRARSARQHIPPSHGAGLCVATGLWLAGRPDRSTDGGDPGTHSSR